jgi:hypothetical protein
MLGAFATKQRQLLIRWVPRRSLLHANLCHCRSHARLPTDENVRELLPCWPSFYLSHWSSGVILLLWNDSIQLEWEFYCLSTCKPYIIGTRSLLQLWPGCRHETQSLQILRVEASSGLQWVLHPKFSLV